MGCCVHPSMQRHKGNERTTAIKYVCADVLLSMYACKHCQSKIGKVSVATAALSDLILQLLWLIDHKLEKCNIGKWSIAIIAAIM